jgi:hypothetical protein
MVVLMLVLLHIAPRLRASVESLLQGERLPAIGYGFRRVCIHVIVGSFPVLLIARVVAVALHFVSPHKPESPLKSRSEQSQECQTYCSNHRLHRHPQQEKWLLSERYVSDFLTHIFGSILVKDTGGGDLCVQDIDALCIAISETPDVLPSS